MSLTKGSRRNLCVLLAGSDISVSIVIVPTFVPTVMACSVALAGKLAQRG